MAQAIHCDWEGDAETPADVLVSQTVDGSTSAWCFAHYVEVCRQVVETVEATIREAADAEAAAKLAGVTPPPGSDQEPAGNSPFLDDFATRRESGPDDQPDRAEGGQPEPEGLGGPETGGPGQPDPGPPSDPSDQPGASTDAPA